MKDLLNLLAAQPPSDFVPPPEPTSNNKKYIMWGCGGCSVMILIGIIGFGLVAYKGCEKVKDTMSDLTAARVALEKTKNYIAEEIEEGDLKEIYEVMAPWYTKKTSYKEFKAQLDPHLDLMQKSFVRSEIDYRGQDDKAIQKIVLTYIPDMKNGIVYVNPEGQQRTLIVSFDCSFTTDISGDLKKIANRGISCPPVLTSVETKDLPIGLEPGVNVTKTVLDTLKVGTSPESYVRSGNQIDVESFKGGGAEATSFLSEVKKMVKDKDLYVGYRRFFIDEKDDDKGSKEPNRIEVAYFEENTDEPVISLFVTRTPSGSYKVSSSDLSKLPEKLPKQPKAKAE